MHQIKLKQNQIIKSLSNITDIFFKQSIIDLANDKRYLRKDPSIDSSIHPCSDEYFEKARTFPIKDYGFPRACVGVSGSAIIDYMPHFDMFEEIRLAMDKFVINIGASCNALSMLYPDNGYIGWHHNGNAPGYNILFTYSIDGEGYFKYYDYSTKSFVILQDNPGWNVRVGYYPDENKYPEKIFWHCAETKQRRITIAFVVNSKSMWENLIDYISEGDFDPAITNVKI